MTINLTPIGTYRTNQFDESAAEIPAFDPNTNRLFVVNAQAVSVDVLDISDPTNPTKINVIDASEFGGVANSVAVKNGLVAIAIEDEDKQAPGRVVFFNANAAEFSEPLKVVEVGALPDMLTFTPDGTKVIVANEGEPNDEYTMDPEGSISIIDLSKGVEEAEVTTADFNAFDSEKAALMAEGVRIFGPNATVSQDLEPEYITVTKDSKTAYVALQENNALAVVDLETNTVTDIVPLGFKNYAAAPSLETYFFDEAELPVIGNTEARGEIKLSGFSGLHFTGVNPENGNLQFITHPDRGPDNGTDENGNRIFLLPELQSQIVSFELNQDSGELIITDRILLKDKEGNPLTGLPNLPELDPDTPVDEAGNLLNYDPLGADLEGIFKAEDGTYWMVDEYRPSIYHFQADGTLIDRYVPQGLPETVGKGVFPEVYNSRTPNRGFEAVAFQNGKVYAFVQSPLNNPVSEETQTIRILEFDPATETIIGEYLYLQEDMGGGSDKIGDAVATKKNGEFLVVERDSNTGEDSKKVVFRINLNQATNLQALPDDILAPGETFESLNAAELAAKGINVVTKEIEVDLADLGYIFTDKPEGFTWVDNGVLAVLNDNDFGADGMSIGLGIIKLNNALDASNEDGAINIRNFPVLGMYQPDAIATYEINGETYIVTANEGDSRDYDGFSEEARVEDLNLAPDAFPNASELQQEDQLGRLNITTTLGQNEDGEYEELYAFGARSFSIWDANGNLIFDSGDQFERIIAEELPEFFNSTNDDNDSFDNRSDDKGPEPEAVTIGVIDGETYAFIGLERVGGIMVYNITDPNSPEFVEYLNNRNFVDENGELIEVELEDGSTNPAVGDLGPEGLIFVSAEDSPNGQDLVVAANEISGTTTIFAIEKPVDVVKPNVVIGTVENDNFDSAFPDEKMFVGETQILITGSGEDWVDVSQVGAGNRIDTGSDNDIVFAGSENRIILGEGDDILFAGDGVGGNLITGGEGSDQFWLIQDVNSLPSMLNSISDFNPDEDVIGFANTGLTLADKGSLWNYEQVGDNVIISAFGQEIAELFDTSITDSNFVLV